MKNFIRCPICGSPTDEGTYFQTPKGWRLVCLECSESMKAEEVRKALEKKEGKAGK
jgi:hypothetical protein